LMNSDIKIVDLSADYRLKLETYEKHYVPHLDTQNLEKSVYGLPEFYEDKIKSAQLVANPGCYPTASLLPILPIADYLDHKYPLVIDAKSGVSGAGKKHSDTTHFVNVNDNFFAYSPIRHRHMPEIHEKILEKTNQDFNVVFVPHILPVTRGMQASIYGVLKENIDVQSILQEFYKDSDFVRIRQTPVTIKQVSGTNFCDIHCVQEKNVIHIESVIDNLLRGASSQAVVNANLMCGLDANIGIPIIAYVP